MRHRIAALVQAHGPTVLYLAGLASFGWGIREIGGDAWCALYTGVALVVTAVLVEANRGGEP